MSQEGLIQNKNEKPSYAQPLNEEEVSFAAVLASLKINFRSFSMKSIYNATLHNYKASSYFNQAS
jgi:hypothetical protein